MNAVQFESNYYTMVKNVNVYVDNYSSRLKILDNTIISEKTIREIINFSRREKLGKIIGTCTINLLESFVNNGFKLEGRIKEFLRGEDGYFISYFIDKNRSTSLFQREEDEILSKSIEKEDKLTSSYDNKFIIRNAVLSDVSQMVKLFTATFKTYPSPVYNSDYLKKVMKDKVLFKVAVNDNKIVSIASADMDLLNLNAEITDCATYPSFRGKGLLTRLIKELEQDLENDGFCIAYSLARAINSGINSAMGKLNYSYCGRLIKNCHICGNFEDMNIWAKKLN